MRLFLLIVIAIALVSCGGKGRRGKGKKAKAAKPVNVAKESRIAEDKSHDEPKKDKIAVEEEVVEEEEVKEEVVKEEVKEEEVVKEVKEDINEESFLTCVHGYKNSFKTQLGTCKTGMNYNCVMVHIKGNSDDAVDKSTTLYGCSPKYTCEKMKNYLSNFEGSSCKICDLKYDKCNGDL